MSERLPEGVRLLGVKPSLLRHGAVGIFDQAPAGYLVVAKGIDGRDYQQAARTWREACELAAMAGDAIAKEMRDQRRQAPPRVGGVMPT